MRSVNLDLTGSHFLCSCKSFKYGKPFGTFDVCNGGFEYKLVSDYIVGFATIHKQGG